MPAFHKKKKKKKELWSEGRKSVICDLHVFLGGLQADRAEEAPCHLPSPDISFHRDKSITGISFSLQSPKIKLVLLLRETHESSLEIGSELFTIC